MELRIEFTDFGNEKCSSNNNFIDDEEKSQQKDTETRGHNIWCELIILLIVFLVVVLNSGDSEGGSDNSNSTPKFLRNPGFESIIIMPRFEIHLASGFNFNVSKSQVITILVTNPNKNQESMNVSILYKGTILSSMAVQPFLRRRGNWRCLFLRRRRIIKTKLLILFWRIGDQIKPCSPTWR